MSITKDILNIKPNTFSIDFCSGVDLFFLISNVCEKFRDSRGFNFIITQEKIFRVIVQVDTSQEGFIVDAHFKALEWWGKSQKQKDLFEIIKISDVFKPISFDVFGIDFSNICDFEAWLQEVEKLNIVLDNIENLRIWVRNMSDATNTGNKDFGDLLNLRKKIEDWFKQMSEDFSTLTIITKGAKEGDIIPEIKTEIKISGDITSVTNLSKDKLTEYHERMLGVSVNLVKSYIQVIIQIVGILLPFAGLGDAGKEAIKAITEMVKAFNIKEA